MRQVSTMPPRLLKTMNDAFFDLSPESVLVYMDPAIGPLQNGVKQLSIRLNARKSRFEMALAGRVLGCVELGDDLVRACHEAFSLYFRTFEQICRAESQPAVLAA